MNRNTLTKCVPPMNVHDGQMVLKRTVPHMSVQQSSLISTNGSCHSGSSTNTTNSLNSHSSSCGSVSSPLENLPKKFVSSMRTLFDIMDDKRTGFVKLSDIEARWQDDGSKGLPHGVIDCLRRVTPVSGMLSFERFCAGLKICLLRSQANDCKISRRSSTDSNSNINTNNNTNGIKTINNENNKNNNNTTINNNINGNNHSINSNNHSNNNSINNYNGNQNIINNSSLNAAAINEDTNKTARLYKRSSLPVQRALSLPKLSPSSDGDSSSDPYIPTAYAPPKPPRTALILSNGSSNISDGKDRCDKAEIRNALQNWQMNLLMTEWEAKDKLDKRRAMAIPNTSYINRGAADGSSASQQSFQQQSASSQQQAQKQQQQHLTSNATNQKPLQSIYPTNRSPTLLEFQKKSNRRREIRRHTLQNGIDYNMLKRIRHYEEEKDLLLDGLHAVEKTQEWYFKQIALIQDKMKCLSQGDGHLEQWSEAHEERLDLRRARIMELNRHLASIEELWERGGLPMHMNLAVRNHHYNSINSSTTGQIVPQFYDVQMNQLNSLKVQNRQLTEEVSQKCERITDLEMERKSLYRELLQQQQQNQQMQQQLLRKQGHILCANEEVIF